MIGIALVLLLILVTGLASFAALRLAYGVRKLAILEPKVLTGSIAWTGDSSARCRLIVIGDSRVAQWPLRPPSGWRAGKIGYSGQSAMNIERAARAALAGVNADVIVIAAGINDAIAAALLPEPDRKVAIERAGEAVIAVAEIARRDGALPIVLTVPPPIAPPMWKRLIIGGTSTELVAHLNSQLAVQARLRNIELLDADGVFRNAEGRLLEPFRRDDLHWSAAGYQVLDALLWARMDRGAESGCFAAVRP